MFWIVWFGCPEFRRRASRAALRLWLAWIVICGLLYACHSPARAQIPVTDIAATIGITKETIETVKNGLTQLQQLQTELQQYQQLLYVGENLIHNPSLGGVMGLANQLGLNTSLPLNPYAVQSLLSGYGGINGINGIMGKLSGLSGLVNSSYNANQISGGCTTNTFACQSAQMQAASTAGLNGISAKMLSDVGDHMNVLQGLRARLATATDPKTVQDATAQIATEQAWLAAQQTQMQAVQTMAQAQQEAFDQAGVQKFRQDLTNYAKTASTYK